MDVLLHRLDKSNGLFWPILKAIRRPICRWLWTCIHTFSDIHTTSYLLVVLLGANDYAIFLQFMSHFYFSCSIWIYCEKEQKLTIFMSELSVCPRKEENRKGAMVQVQVIISFCFKGIFQPFELGGVTRLIRSAVKFWKAGNLNFFFLMIQTHERSLKQISPA